MKKIIFLLAAFLILSAAVSFAEEGPHGFPFIGKVKDDNVNIRAGANQNFEILAKANSGDFLYVSEEAYGWYKVRLPKSAHCYVAKDFIEKKDDAAVSKTGSLNLRAKPNRESSVVGQVHKGDKVRIVSEDIDGWYEIFPTENSFGWVRADLIEYTLSDVQKWIADNAEKVVNKEEVKAKPAPVAQGQIQNMGFTFRRRPGSHRLVLAGKTIYYLRSDKINLNNFQGQDVSIWGDIKDLKTDKLVIDVAEIEICK
jgi:uncharacterized protein YgiM (DUF1202 family)